MFHFFVFRDRLVVDFQFYNIYHDDMDDIDRKFNFDLLVSNLTLTHASRSISYFFHQNPKWLHYSYDVASLVVRSVGEAFETHLIIGLGVCVCVCVFAQLYLFVHVCKVAKMVMS